MNRPVHFEIHAGDPERAAAFYRAVFGWDVTPWGPPGTYWVVRTGEGPGIDGGLLPRRGPPPADGAPVNASVITVSVVDLEAALRAVTGHGGTIVSPRAPIPGVGWLAYGKDPEGNLFGLMQDDPAAG